MMNGNTSSASSSTALQGPANPTGNVQFTYYDRAENSHMYDPDPFRPSPRSVAVPPVLP